MVVVNLTGIVVEYGLQRVLDSVQWEIQRGDRVGLVGVF